MTTEDASRVDYVLRHERESLGKPEARRAADAVKEEGAASSEGVVGLALSGGGIRSATFSLGVLQALATRNRLSSFDYLSTVSGGGYIGSWLSAWIHRAGLREVQQRLAEAGSGTAAVPRSIEAPEITWLRRYSNYLAPRVGLLSLDALTLVTTWLRNVSLNFIVLTSALALLFMTPLELTEPLSVAAPYQAVFGFAAAWLGFILLFAIAYNLWHQGLPITRQRKWLISPAGVAATVIVPGVLASCAASLWLFLTPPSQQARSQAIGYVVGLLILLLLIWTVVQIIGRAPKASLLKQICIFAVAAAGGMAAGAGVLESLVRIWPSPPSSAASPRFDILVCFAPPAMLFAFGVAGTVYTGLVGRVFYERSREWWSRLNAWFLAIGSAWLALGLLAFFALPTLRWFTAQLGNWMALLGTGWIGTLLTAIFARKPDGATGKTQLRFDKLLNAAASIFAIGLLIVIAAGTSEVLLTSAGITSSPIASSAMPNFSFSLRSEANRVDYQASIPKPAGFSLGDALQAHVMTLDHLRAMHGLIPGTSFVLSAMVIALAVLLLFGWRVDINKFSLHNMYKNRLVRCYLGASNQSTRNQEPFTGLDDKDDIPLSRLEGQRPYHIVNTTLNLSQGSNLAWQERKGASFTFTPRFCGYSLERTQGDSTPMDGPPDSQLPGYRPTKEYAAQDVEERGFSLGMALATSGAAVSPDMGYATRPAHAFVLTLFNARLGRWSPNPAQKKWRKPAPRFGLMCLLQELLGYSNERRNFVYLSDGGHFENLGLYELIRRRCSLIIAVDAGADPQRAFDDLANAVRKCRVDLGVEITFDRLDELRGDKDMRAQQGFTAGTIWYGPAGSGRRGTIILIKPSLCRAQDEPADVLNYAKDNPPFPQQSTLDQFFDESQFESYRRLGFCIGERCLAQHQSLLPLREAAAHNEFVAAQPDGPAFATKWLGFVFFRRAARQQGLPPRMGSLVDFLVLSLLISILFGIGWAVARLVQGAGASSGPCLSVDACRHALGAALSAGSAAASPSHSGLFWLIQCDNFFILAYTATFLMGYVAAVSRVVWADRTRLRWALCSLALLGALMNYIENFLLLGAIGTRITPEVAAQIAPFAMLTWYLFFANLVLLLSLAVKLSDIFRSRWHRWTTAR